MIIVYLIAWVMMVGALLIAELRVRRACAERDSALFALKLHVAQRAGRQYVDDLLADFQRQVELEGIELEDGEAAAHAFADFLANQTGQTIVAQQLDGDGIIVAIPDDQEAT